MKNQCIVTAATATARYCQWCSVQSPTVTGAAAASLSPRPHDTDRHTHTHCARRHTQTHIGLRQKLQMEGDQQTPLKHTHTHEHGGRQVQQPKHGHALLHGREGQGSVGSNAPARTQRRQNGLRTAAAARGCLPRTATLPGPCVFW